MNKKLILILLFATIVCLPAQGMAAGNVYYDFGVFALDEGNLNEAEKYFLQAMSKEPDNPYCNQFLGKTYFQMGRFDDALRYTEKAWHLNPSLPGLGYDRGMAYYKTGNYEQAETIFSTLYQKEPDNALAVYYAGMSCFKQQQFRDALQYLNIAAEMNMSIRDNSYYFAGLCYQQLGETEKAIDKLDYVAEFATSDPLRKSASEWLEKLRKEGEKGVPYSLYLKLGLQYDDNVLLEPLDQNLPTDQGDSLIVGFFAGRYNLVNKPDQRFGVGYSHYQTRYTNLSEEDLIGSTLTFYFQQRLNTELTLICSYRPTFYWLDYNSYLRRHQLQPELIWQPVPGRTIRFSYNYSINKYFQDNDSDGHRNALDVDIYQKVLGQKGELLVGLGYENNAANSPDEDYDWYRGGIGLSYNMSWNLKLRLRGALIYKKYAHVDSYYKTQREDDKYKFTASLSRPILKDRLVIQGEYQYTKNDSNIATYSYKKNVYTVSAITKF